MNDLALYIFKQERKEAKKIQYTFVLEEPGLPPVIGNRIVDSLAWTAVAGSYAKISKAVKTFLAATQADGSEYRKTVAGVVDTLSSTVRSGFWPKASEAEGEAFAKKFADIESAAAASPERYHLLIATNDTKVPWWIARALPPNRDMLICEIFGLGMISLRTSQPQPVRSNPPISVRVITCPSRDLAMRTHAAEVGLDKELVKDLEQVADYALLSGKRHDPEGLDEAEVREGFADGRVVLYHGHFNLCEDEPRRIKESTISVASDPAGDRDVPDLIKIATLASNNGLKNKDIIFIGCETAGMHPAVDETLAEYLAKQDSTLVGTLYPILDDQARTFANKLAESLFRDFLSWGQAVRTAREVAKEDDSLFYRAAYCYFGVPWRMSPLFDVRKSLHVLVPTYLASIYELVKPEKVYSSILLTEFVPPVDLEKTVDDLKQETEDIWIAALPSVFTAELLQTSDEWVVLGPMVASDGDIRIVAVEKGAKFNGQSVWLGKEIVYKGPRLTASAFLEVLLHKRGVETKPNQWKTVPNDCAPIICEELADFGLVVAREDLAIGEAFPGGSSLCVDTELSKEYGGELIPRILWVTKKACLRDWRRYYIVEFFKRLGERITDENQVHELRIPKSNVTSRVKLYRIGKEYQGEVDRARQTLCKFLEDWAALDKRKQRRAITEEDWYDWSEPAVKSQA